MEVSNNTTVIKILEAELEELQDLINCGEYRVDFNRVEIRIKEVELLIEDLKLEEFHIANISEREGA